MMNGSRQAGASTRSTLITYAIPLQEQQEEKQVSTWVIAYRNADRSEHQIQAKAAGVLTEQGAAMLVSDYLRQQQASSTDTPLAAEQYNFQIIRIHRVPGDVESA
ncbi:hypothetical protein [Pseudoduganella sp. R-34]|uniref:hypothetical protein n=1 Tax=Pseudoduganella sp. R-34 TaxID=3404062 RepID=UPI003CEB454D